VEIGKYERIKMVVDNLQSGPDTGKGIAEALMVKHVVLTNFPTESGYLAAIEENIETIIKAATQK
jgi:zinc transport system substrate-binding protein